MKISYVSDKNKFGIVLGFIKTQNYIKWKYEDN